MMSVQNNIESNGNIPSTLPDTSSGNIITASDSAKIQKQTPTHWIFAFDSENSPVLPFNIRRSGTMFSVFSDGNEYLFSSFEEATRHAETNFRPCPFSGRPVPTGPQNIGQLCKYLKNSYPDVFSELSSHGRIKKLYVFDDGYFLNNRSLHPEICCRNGLSCHGINGGCSFNHEGMPWCKYEISPTSRCRSSKCKYNHGRGRVKHDNLMRFTPRSSVAPLPSAPVKETKEDSPLEDLSSVSVNLDQVFTQAEAEDDNSEGEWTVVTSKRSKAKTEKSKAKTEKSKAKTEKSKAKTEKSKPKTEKSKPKTEKSKPNISLEEQFPSLSTEVVTTPTLTWKERCDLQKAEDQERIRLEKEREDEKIKLEEESKQAILDAEIEARLEAERQKLEQEAQKQRDLEAQFDGLISYSKVVKNDHTFNSRKSSRKSRKVKKEKTDEEKDLMMNLFKR